MNHHAQVQHSIYPQYRAVPQHTIQIADSVYSHYRRAGDTVDLSIVIPVFNEEDNLWPLHERLQDVLQTLAGKTYEIVLIDDGSTDGSTEILMQLSQDDPHVYVICFRRNFGQTAAFSAGFDFARGDVVITLDADLQNEPEDIPRLLEKMEEGYDVVSGWRVDRQDPFLTRRLPSMIANRLISKTTGVELHDYGCSLKAYRRVVLDNVELYGELHRFIPALASWMGIKVAEIPVNHAPRNAGRSKYGLSRTLKVVLDLITVKFLLDFATRPIHVFGLAGLLFFSSGTALGLYLSIQKLFFNQGLGDRPLLLLAVLLVILGVQLIAMGLLGELIVRTYYETQGKPIYVVREVLGIPKSTSDPRRSG